MSYGRPSYGGSSPNRGRTVGSAASDVAQLMDAAGVDRFAVMGASGGGPHALACAAALLDRVVAAVTLSSPAPFTPGPDWYAGMVAREASSRPSAAARNVSASRRPTIRPEQLHGRRLGGARRSVARLGADAGRAGAASPEGLVDDDLALVAPWGVDLAAVRAPVWLVHGGDDRVIPPITPSGSSATSPPPSCGCSHGMATSGCCTRSGRDGLAARPAPRGRRIPGRPTGQVRAAGGTGSIALPALTAFAGAAWSRAATTTRSTWSTATSPTRPRRASFTALPHPALPDGRARPAGVTDRGVPAADNDATHLDVTDRSWRDPLMAGAGSGADGVGRRVDGTSGSGHQAGRSS